MTLHRQNQSLSRFVAVFLALAVAGCAASTTAADTASETSAAGSDATAAADSAATADTAASADTQTVDTVGLPAAPTPYAGTCPDFADGAVQMQVGKYGRSLLVTLPEQPKGAGVLFLWHGLGDTAKNFNNAFGAKQLATTLNAVVITPDACCNTATAKGCCSMMTGWHFVADTAIDADIFDGALSCLEAQHGIDRKRVYTMGFSAGGLWSTWLVMHRSAQLAAAAILSGGVNDYNPWSKPALPVPVVDSSGGPTDLFGSGLVDFQASTETLNKYLRGAGHFVVHCQHNQGHTVTPDIVQFALHFLSGHSHDAKGQSPLATGLPVSAPAGCKILP